MAGNGNEHTILIKDVASSTTGGSASGGDKGGGNLDNKLKTLNKAIDDLSKSSKDSKPLFKAILDELKKGTAASLPASQGTQQGTTTSSSGVTKGISTATLHKIISESVEKLGTKLENIGRGKKPEGGLLANLENTFKTEIRGLATRLIKEGAQQVSDKTGGVVDASIIARLADRISAPLIAAFKSGVRGGGTKQDNSAAVIASNKKAAAAAEKAAAASKALAESNARLIAANNKQAAIEAKPPPTPKPKATPQIGTTAAGKPVTQPKSVKQVVEVVASSHPFAASG